MSENSSEKSKEMAGSNGTKNNAPSSKTIEDLLKLLGVSETAESEPQAKPMKDYKFWKTQPVPNFDEEITEEGPIDALKTPADIPENPYPLLKDFEWVTMDLDDADEIKDVYELLHENYVEDSSEIFRFKYTKEFFNWGLKPPGWKKQWHVGVRVKETNRLVAFIAGIPLDLELRGKGIRSVEINFICVHKKLRNKRLAPVLIKEITRRVNREDIWQAFYTAGVVLPSPVSVCRYTHRPLNWEKLYDVGFSALQPNETIESMTKLYEVPTKTQTPGLRKAEFKDLEQIYELYDVFHNRYEMVQRFSKDEIAHWLLGAVDPEEAKKNQQVIHTYVVEDSTGKITDFFSFYLLPFSILKNPKHESLNVAYLFYYASSVGVGKSRKDKENQSLLKERLQQLVNDALIICKGLDIDVFNALTSQDNTLFLEDLKFGLGDGYLNYYLFNWRTSQITGGINEATKQLDPEAGSGVGVVML
ncbi:glycylpeptide N-tetradecanoyltransferase [Saccharomycopsis crataegensis]|uniref:Glycylpeptide N-tetradecanoyltransferase n=1 Tax=Saccharomycopsis crataegensis TaxID=43959 RepID=A0AAV5QJC7_9ASCO|nr:glycylpeptide N-tetradecanoyltransferase [Saccharomycopsis crataegensis]